MPEPIVWVLCDDRAGNVGQALGVAEALGLPFTRIDLAYNKLASLPNFMLGGRLWGLDRPSRARLTGPWPDLVIAAGRRTAPIARFIKHQNKRVTKLIQVMDPGNWGASDFDLIAVPAHDAGSAHGGNYMSIQGAPHRVNDEKLQAARTDWQDTFSDLPTPRIALIVGGATKNKDFSAEQARLLGQEVNAAAEQACGSLLVTTSRRTGVVADDIFKSLTVPAHGFKWGDQGENPYFGYLACADYIIVTGDSVSMCCEACASGRPVYIYAPENMISAKHQRMVRGLIEAGHARLWQGELTAFTPQPLNSAHEIAQRARQLLQP